MEISSLSPFLTSLQEKVRKDQVVEVLDAMLEVLPILDLKMIDLDTLQKIKEILEQIPLDKHTDKEIRAKWMACMVGGKVPFEVFLEKELKIVQFIELNQLHKKFLALGIQLAYDAEKGIALPIEIEPYVYQEMHWSELTEVVLKSESSIALLEKIRGYRYYFRGILVFQTDPSYRLIETFSPLLKGIAYYDPINSASIPPIDRRDPAEWHGKNQLEIWTWSGKLEGYMIWLKDQKGFIYNAGVVKGKISTPDPRFFEEISLRNLNKFVIEISYEQVKELIRQISDDKFYRHIKRSKGHLIDSIEKVLGIKIENRKWGLPFFGGGISIKKLEKSLRRMKDVRESKRD